MKICKKTFAKYYRVIRSRKIVSDSSEHLMEHFACVCWCVLKVDAEVLGWWLCERQLPCGGLNGRPEKLQDVCYSWWVLSALAILGKLSWIDRRKLAEFILSCQDPEKGGISDRPGNQADVFHTYFGIAGLSLLGQAGKFSAIDPVFALPVSTIRRLKLKTLYRT
eukprot:g72636.t1